MVSGLPFGLPAPSVVLDDLSGKIIPHISRVQAGGIGGACHGSSGHKITARLAASWITELSRAALTSVTPHSSQDATKVTGPSGGRG